MALVFTSFVFDRTPAVYSPGEPITLTVSFTSDDVVPPSEIASAVTVALSDQASGTVSMTSDGSASFPGFSVASSSETVEPATVEASDNRATPGTWTVAQPPVFTGSAAPFAGTAVLTSVA